MYIEKSFDNIKKIIPTNQLGILFFPQYVKTFLKKANPKMVWVISDDLILPVVVCNKALFRWATLLAVPIGYKGQGNITQEYLDQVCATLKKSGIQWITSTLAASPFPAFPHKSKRIPFGTHIIDLNQPEEVLMQNMHSKHRNVVKRAEKDGVEIKIGGKELLNDYVRLETATWARSEKNSNGFEYYEQIVEALDGNVDVSVAYFNGEPQSGAITYWGNTEAYYMFGANIDNPHIGSGNLLQWKLLCLYKSRGVQKYNFVGCRIGEDEDSKYHGIQRFKERFGGELVEGYMFKIVLKPMYASLWDTIYKLIKGVPAPDAIDQEIHKWEELNCE